MVPPIEHQRRDRADRADVEHRRGDEVDLVVAAQLVRADQHHALREQVLVREHRALGAAGGAGGVHDQRRRVLGYVDRVGRLALARRPPRSRRRSVPRTSPTATTDTALDVRSTASRTAFCRGLVGEQQLGAGVVEDVGDLAAGQPEVHRHPDRPEPVGREHDLHELGPVAHQHGHPVTEADTARGQRAGEPLDPVVQLAPGRGLALEPERRRGRAGIGRAGRGGCSSAPGDGHAGHRSGSACGLLTCDRPGPFDTALPRSIVVHNAKPVNARGAHQVDPLSAFRLDDRVVVLTGASSGLGVVSRRRSPPSGPTSSSRRAASTGSRTSRPPCEKPGRAW